VKFLLALVALGVTTFSWRAIGFAGLIIVPYLSILGHRAASAAAQRESCSPRTRMDVARAAAWSIFGIFIAYGCISNMTMRRPLLETAIGFVGMTFITLVAIEEIMFIAERKPKT
jgi:hypothetical protein